MNRRHFLAGTGAGLLFAAHAQAAVQQRKKLIFILADGGWDVTFAFDPKADVPEIAGPEVDLTEDPDDAEYVSTLHGMPLALNDFKRPNVTTFFKTWGSRTAIVNGIHVGAIGHAPARMRMITGAPQVQRRPDLATITGSVHGQDLTMGCLLLSPLAVPMHLAPSTVVVGARNQLVALLDDKNGYPAPVSSGLNYPLYTPNDQATRAIEAFHQRRLTAMGAAWDGPGRSAERIAQLQESTDRAKALRSEVNLLSNTLNVGTSPTFMLSSIVAVDLLEQGVCHSVFLDTGHQWDTHIANVDQHGMFNSTFNVLNSLASDLSARNMLGDTLVVVVSEMTRTPRINVQAGKDHWPYTSALLLGGGTVGGQTLGATGDNLNPLPVDYQTGQTDDKSDKVLTFEAFNAGLMERLDVDPAEWLPGAPIWRGGTV